MAGPYCRREDSQGRRKIRTYGWFDPELTPRFHPPTPPETLSQSAMKRLIDYQNKLEWMQIERDEAQARIKILQELWNQLNGCSDHRDSRIKDAGEGSTRRMTDAGGRPVEITPEQALHLPGIPFQILVLSPLPPILPRTRCLPKSIACSPPSPTATLDRYSE